MSGSSNAGGMVDNVEVVKLVLPVMDCHSDIVKGIRTNDLGGCRPGAAAASALRPLFCCAAEHMHTT